MASSPETRPLTAGEAVSAAPAESRRRRLAALLSFENRIFLLALATGLPALTATLLLLIRGGYNNRIISVTAVILLWVWWKLAVGLRDKVVRPLQTLANLLGAVREGDFSLRARLPEKADALGQVMHEVNAIAATLREQRLGAVEATALLHRVMEEVDVSVFAFDDQETLRLVNRAGERLLGESADHLLGRGAAPLGLEEFLEGEGVRTTAKTFPGGPGRWEVRRSLFREQGLPHKLLVITDLSRTLREEERQAWKRLIRVLGHELNNSLAPIRSMASTLAYLLEKQPEDWKEDMMSGLDIIGNRSEALIRFMAVYARLAKLPPRAAA